MRVLIPHRSLLEANALFGCFHTNLDGILRFALETDVLDSSIKVKGDSARFVDSSLSSVLISACRGGSRLAPVPLDCNFDAVHTREAIPWCLARVSCTFSLHTFIRVFNAALDLSSFKLQCATPQL